MRHVAKKTRQLRKPLRIKVVSNNENNVYKDIYEERLIKNNNEMLDNTIKEAIERGSSDNQIKLIENEKINTENNVAEKVARPRKARHTESSNEEKNEE